MKLQGYSWSQMKILLENHSPCLWDLPCFLCFLCGLQPPTQHILHPPQTQDDGEFVRELTVLQVRLVNSWNLIRVLYRVTLVVQYLGWADLNLESSHGWWATTAAIYCPSWMVEHSISKSTQPRYLTTRVTLYVPAKDSISVANTFACMNGGLIHYSHLGIDPTLAVPIMWVQKPRFLLSPDRSLRGRMMPNGVLIRARWDWVSNRCKSVSISN